MGKFKHGKSKTRLYNIWLNMKARCYNLNNHKYNDYGGRGITICEAWLNDFQAFYDWAMANGYSDDLSIDRIDVNGNYEPSNCRWTDNETQSNNRRSNRFIEYNGKSQTIEQWAKELNVDYKKFHSRLKRGWSIEKAISPKNNTIKEVTYQGKTQSISSWARELNITSATLSCRLRKGWDIKRAFETPAQKQFVHKNSCPIITFNGKTKPLTEWAKELNIKVNTLYSRINRGWSIERTLTTPSRKINKK